MCFHTEVETVEDSNANVTAKVIGGVFMLLFLGLFSSGSYYLVLLKIYSQPFPFSVVNCMKNIFSFFLLFPPYSLYVLWIGSCFFKTFDFYLCDIDKYHSIHIYQFFSYKLHSIWGPGANIRTLRHYILSINQTSSAIRRS